MMVRILDEALSDILEGSKFYESQCEGLGSRFVESVFVDIDSLALDAGIHAIYFGFHRLLAKRFPFAVYYRVENGAAFVFAVLDCRRDPAWIRGRLQNS